MNTTIQFLKEKQTQLVEQLRRENATVPETLQEKKDIDKAIVWLKNIEKQNLEHPTRYEWVELPWMQNGFSDYRIMSDCETDDREHWLEFKTPSTVTLNKMTLKNGQRKLFLKL